MYWKEQDPSTRTGVAALVLSVSLAFRMCVRNVVPRLRLQRASCWSRLAALRAVTLLWGDLLCRRAGTPLTTRDLAGGSVSSSFGVSRTLLRQVGGASLHIVPIYALYEHVSLEVQEVQG